MSEKDIRDISDLATKFIFMESKKKNLNVESLLRISQNVFLSNLFTSFMSTDNNKSANESIFRDTFFSLLENVFHCANSMDIKGLEDFEEIKEKYMRNS
jgi:hypothetical protein